MTRTTIKQTNAKTIMTNEIETNDDATTTTKRERVAKTFTIAQFARELKIDEKIARRRMRANVAREKSSQLNAPTPTKCARKNERYTFVDNATNRAMIKRIITNA